MITDKATQHVDETDTDVLEKLDFEHELPCEWKSDRGACTDAADWVIRDNLAGHESTRLMCTPHKVKLFTHAATCPNCSRIYRILSVGPLR